MGFDGKRVLLALCAANGDQILAVEYLLNGIPQEEVEEVGHSGGAATQDQDNINGDDSSNYHEPDQEQKEQQVALRIRNRGFDEEEIDQPPAKKPLKRPRDKSSDTTSSHNKQKKSRRAPAPPRYKGLTRKEYTRRVFGEDEKDVKSKGASQELTMVEAKQCWKGEQWQKQNKVGGVSSGRSKTMLVEWTMVEAKQSSRKVGCQWHVMADRTR